MKPSFLFFYIYIFFLFNLNCLKILQENFSMKSIFVIIVISHLMINLEEKKIITAGIVALTLSPL